MNTILHIPGVPWLSLAWPRKVLRRWVEPARPDAESARDLEALSGLDARTLRDIGAPEPLLARELARRQDELAIAKLSGDWRRW